MIDRKRARAGWKRALRTPVRTLTALGVAAAMAAGGVALAAGMRAPDLDPGARRELQQAYRTSLTRKKGPFDSNVCACQDGSIRPVLRPDGSVSIPCANPVFCSAYRNQYGKTMAKHGVYVANLFARDLYEWDDYDDHNDLVRGFVLEKFFIDTHPDHKFAEMRSYRGIASSEEEAPAAAKFEEKYLSAPEFDVERDYLLAYELQRRFFVGKDVGQIQEVRSAATRVQNMDADFKPLKDAIHNQLTAALIPKLEDYAQSVRSTREKEEIRAIVEQIRKLTTIDDSVLPPAIAKIGDAALQKKLDALVPEKGAGPVEAISSLSSLMQATRDAVTSGKLEPADARRAIDVAIVAGTVLQTRATDLLQDPEAVTAREGLEVLRALTNAAYGAGLLSERERAEAVGGLDELLAKKTLSRDELKRGLARAQRVVEWAQGNVNLAFAPVWAGWTLVMPDVAGIVDDVLRGSPLLPYATYAQRLDDFAAGKARPKHEIFGQTVDSGVRALNPGLTIGTLRVAPKSGTYSRNDVLALPETPADLQPAAGIATRGEGNVLSHVQLLARALGIPNVVVAPEIYGLMEPHDGERVFMLATPGGRVIVKRADQMTAEEQSVYAEYTRNDPRSGTGKLGQKSGKLHIDKERIDLGPKLPIDLADLRRKDSGIKSGPKAAYLGELKHLFPDKVSRGFAVPFGAYHQHFQNAKVAVPDELAGKGLAEPGEPLPAFVDRTYATFFGEMIPSGESEARLNAWIEPRLEVMQHSIRQAPLDPTLEKAIRQELARQDLLVPGDPEQTVGVFIRSDTNVEDLDNFNGAGLNLTLFNKRSVDAVLAGLKEVWASPFSMRSFSWRQTLIDEPSWVLPSVVILESVPSEKSGVLVTADVDHGDPEKMLIATSEGVGGAVDGTSAETLLWSPDGVEIITLFKSPWKQALQPDGGSAMVPSTGTSRVLQEADIRKLVAAGKKVRKTLEPARGPRGEPRPWDVEFGFADGKLWLFQVRPFIGNDSLKNVPALKALEESSGTASRTVSLDAKIG